jgi:lysophospholipase L1-like esterase
VSLTRNLVTGAVFAAASLGIVSSSSGATGASTAGGPPLPSSIAALGDSITQAFDVVGDTITAHPAYSWSTGTIPAVKSQYQRILAANPAIAGHSFNFARTGAEASGLAAQAAQAVAVQAQYVTILIGANDLCTDSLAQMTPTTTFSAHVASALNVLERGLPSAAHIFVASIPNLGALWQSERSNPTAALVWNYAGVCLDLLGSSSTNAERNAVLAREAAYNSALLADCARWANCRFDSFSLFHYRFVASQVSSLDFYHPSVSGQAEIAFLTWAHSWWPSQP